MVLFRHIAVFVGPMGVRLHHLFTHIDILCGMVFMRDFSRHADFFFRIFPAGTIVFGFFVFHTIIGHASFTR